ncbi:MAG TPA: carboxypeptidase regulatory-like domain-containing protein [Longimicrobiaceae bacterium]|nr:carboxypeptidase regulatory-like domain-containing protein [Longimicrobiaceae bacterium]
MRHFLPRLLALCIGLHGGTAAAQASSPGEQTGEISGRVIDSETREPLQGASVVLETVSVDGGSPGSGFRSEPRLIITESDGGYRFTGLPPANYRLDVSRIGYIGAGLEVDLRSAPASRLSVGLETDPIELAPLAVVGGRPEPYGRVEPSGSAQSGRGLLIERTRQERYLVSDTRELTHAEVLAAVTLAETDLFRALQRVPGVSTRDDYTATMWTRGASWDQTRVYFDELPLYNPTHAGWLFAAVNPDAVASASFHPGYRSARWGEGSAGVLDLRSRSGRPGGQVRGNAEISLASTRLSLDGELPRTYWMVAGRRSYVDLLSSIIGGFVGADDLHIPYDFTDVAGRVDVRLGGGWQLEASSIFEYDHLRGDIPGLLEGNRGRWGNRLARVALIGPVGPLRAKVTAGGTDFSTLIFERAESPGTTPTLPTLENGIRHRMLAFEVEPERRTGTGVSGWTLGMQVMRDSVSYDGPFSLIGAIAAGVRPDREAVTPFRYGNALAHSALWGEKRWSLGPSVNVLTGLRLEMGDSVSNGGRYRLAPRVAMRAEPGGGLALTAAWTRAFQYTQDVSPAAGPIGPQLHLSAIWVLASPARVFPAVQTDLATAGVEQAWGDGWSVLANVYDRRSTGLKIPNPTPGPVSAGRDPDAEASNEAWGVELSIRRITGQWTGSLGYARGFSWMRQQPRTPEALGHEFASSSDIRHSFDATALARVGSGVQLGGAFTFGSGVPFTQLLIDGSADGASLRLGLPNAERTPAYASFDLMVEYERRYTDWLISGYLQIRNVTNRNNAVTYAGTWNCPAEPPVSGSPTYREVCSGSSGVTHRFEPGLPRLPLIGLRIAF